LCCRVTSGADKRKSLRTKLSKLCTQST
jgi:hypothetical protein